jgi:DnaJ-class molecular chaperone
MKKRMRCGVCKGKGKITVDDSQYTCISCVGTGTKAAVEKWCPECDGIMTKGVAGWVCYYGCQK